MQSYTIFFITVNALRVSGGLSAHHQELRNCTHSIATAGGSSKQAWHIPDDVPELLMMGGETARNTYSIDNNKEYCITLHLAGCT